MAAASETADSTKFETTFNVSEGGTLNLQMGNGSQNLFENIFSIMQSNRTGKIVFISHLFADTEKFN